MAARSRHGGNDSTTGDFGQVREFGKDQNNATTATQPILIETPPPPADLKVTNVVVPAQGTVGSEVEISYTIQNDSDNPARGSWTDALYLSADNAWDLADKLLGKVDRSAGELAGHASYTASLKAKLPPLKDGRWRPRVRHQIADLAVFVQPSPSKSTTYERRRKISVVAN